MFPARFPDQERKETVYDVDRHDDGKGNDQSERERKNSGGKSRGTDSSIPPRDEAAHQTFQKRQQLAMKSKAQKGILPYIRHVSVGLHAFAEGYEDDQSQIGIYKPILDFLCQAVQTEGSDIGVINDGKKSEQSDEPVCAGIEPVEGRFKIMAQKVAQYHREHSHKYIIKIPGQTAAAP